MAGEGGKHTQGGAEIRFCPRSHPEKLGGQANGRRKENDPGPGGAEAGASCAGGPVHPGADGAGGDPRHGGPPGQGEQGDRPVVRPAVNANLKL